MSNSIFFFNEISRDNLDQFGLKIVEEDKNVATLITDSGVLEIELLLRGQNEDKETEEMRSKFTDLFVKENYDYFGFEKMSQEDKKLYIELREKLYNIYKQNQNIKSANQDK